MTKSAFANVGAVVFDAYGTLFDVHSAIARGGAALGGKAKAVSTLWRQKQLEYTWLRSLMGAHADFWQVTREGLDYALAANGVEDSVLAEALMQEYLALAAYPDAVDCLKRLKDGDLKTAILTNGSPKMIEAAVKSSGIGALLDALLSIEEVGIYKPDPRVYKLSVERLGIGKERICFVSSNAWDAAGAAYFGFRVAWMNRFGQPPEHLPGQPAAIISGLAELAPLLGR